MGRLILILGGARSGKSTLALQMAQEQGGDAVLFVATAEAGDAEMQERIAAHRQERSVAWRTLEAPMDVAARLPGAVGDARVVVLDCLTLLVSNVLLAAEQGTPDDEAAWRKAAAGRVDAEIAALLGWTAQHPATLIAVSNEVGWGLVPPYSLGRAYRDLLGAANRRLAAQSAEVWLVVAGIPLELKSLAQALSQHEGVSKP